MTETAIIAPREPTWAPLRNRLFRAMWIASVASNVGSWMQTIGGEWMMTTLAPTPMMVALMQTAGFLPIFLLALPAGALADIVDRRRLLIFAQACMFTAAATLAVLAMLDMATPLVLLMLTFAMGIGGAIYAPVAQAILPELVPRRQLPQAISINAVAYNIARAVGPALGGIVVAAGGPAAVFSLNALSFLGIIVVIYRWDRERGESISPSERVVGAMRAGIRYVRHAPELKNILIRAGIFSACASALWALLALFVRSELGYGAVGYGVILGGLGAGAITGAFVLPQFRRSMSPNRLVVYGTLLFAAASVSLAYVREVVVVEVIMMFGGLAWMATFSTLNISVQSVVPDWVRARALALYLLVTFGALALGSAVWGAVAERVGIPIALVASAATLVASVLAAWIYRMPSAESLDLTPSLHWSEPVVINEPDPEQGPVLVTVEYFIDPARAEEFREAMNEVERTLRRDGATRWGLFEDIAQPGRYLETFLVESWAEHMRQHARVTIEDRDLTQRVHAFHLGANPPAVSHLLATTGARNWRRFIGA